MILSSEDNVPSAGCRVLFAQGRAGSRIFPFAFGT